MADYINTSGFGFLGQQLNEQAKMADMQRKMLMDAYMEAKKKQHEYESAANNPLRQVAAIGMPLAGMAIGGAYGGPVGAAIGSSIGTGVGQAVSKIGMPGQPPDMSPVMQGMQPLFQRLAMDELYKRYYGGGATEVMPGTGLDELPSATENYANRGQRLSIEDLKNL